MKMLMKSNIIVLFKSITAAVLFESQSIGEPFLEYCLLYNIMINDHTLEAGKIWVSGEKPEKRQISSVDAEWDTQKRSSVASDTRVFSGSNVC